MNTEVIWESSPDSLRCSATSLRCSDSANWLQPARPVEYNPEHIVIFHVLHWNRAGVSDLVSEFGKRQPLIALNTELLAATLKSSAESILLKDCNGTILIGSQGVANFYGCSVDELPGLDAYSALPPDLAARIQERDRITVETGETEISEETWDLGYEQRTLLVSRSPVRGKDGTILGVVTGYKNISAIKQAYLLFEQNQKRFLALADTCPVGIFECNPYHQITYVNPEWERIMGLRMSDVIGQKWTEFVAEEHLHLVQPLIEGRVSARGDDRVDCQLRGKNECMVELSLNRVANLGNHTVSYIGSAVDLTYRLAAELQLREKANLMRDLTSSVPAIIWQLSHDAQCIFVSDFWEELTGKPIAAALERNWEDVIHPEDLNDVVAQFQAVLTQQKKSASFEFRLEGRTGQWRWVLSTFQQLHNTEGKCIGLAGHSIDITDRRQAEIELLHYSFVLEERVSERTIELSRANESLQGEIETRRHAEEMLEEKRSELAHFSRIAVMGKLSGELAHELNQPLNAIQNYVGSLEKILSSSPALNAATSILEQLNKEIVRAAKIIRRTRDFVSTGTHRSEELDVSELVADTALMLRGEARRRGLTIQIIDNAKHSLFLGDPIRLQQVLVNLVLNGLEAMVDHDGSNKLAVVEIAKTSQGISIAVHDSGCGVEESERERLFEAFFTTKATGLGMGLAISRGIIEDHGGTLTYQPRESGGSTFVIELRF